MAAQLLMQAQPPRGVGIPQPPEPEQKDPGLDPEHLPKEAYRAWRLHWEAGEPVLQSCSRGDLWREAEFTADAKPTETNQSGIYTKRTLQQIEQMNYSWAGSECVVGKVALMGKVQPHDNGVLRAEKVRILALRYKGEAMVTQKMPAGAVPFPGDGITLLRRIVQENTPLTGKLLPGTYTLGLRPGDYEVGPKGLVAKVGAGSRMWRSIVLPEPNQAHVFIDADEQATFGAEPVAGDGEEVFLCCAPDGNLYWGYQVRHEPEQITRMLSERYEVPVLEEDVSRET